MITATLQEVREAHQALRSINSYTRLTSDPAWKVSRLLGKLKRLVVDYEETQLKLYKDAGGLENMGGVALDIAPRSKDESEEYFATRVRDHRVKVDGLLAELRALNKQQVEIESDPLPLSLFKDRDNTPDAEQKKYNANDFVDAGVFIKE